MVTRIYLIKHNLSTTLQYCISQRGEGDLPINGTVVRSNPIRKVIQRHASPKIFTHMSRNV